MYPLDSPSIFVALAVLAETISLVLFGRANTLWRSAGMHEYPQRFIILRSLFVMLWVHIGILTLAPLGFTSAYPSFSVEYLWLLLLGLFGGLGLILFSLSIRSMPAQLVFFGGSIHLVVAVVVGWLLGEVVSPLRMGVILILLVAQLSILWRDRGHWLVLKSRQRLLPFVVGVVWGTYFPFYGMAIHEFGFWPTLVTTEWGVFILALTWFCLQPKGRWNDSTMWKNMGEQSILSSIGQALSGVALWWGGIILHSILTNFNVLINISAFRIRYGEVLQLKYVAYFVVYMALAAMLVWVS